MKAAAGMIMHINKQIETNRNSRMEKSATTLEMTSNQLIFESETNRILLKKEEEEIWKQNQLIAHYDDITGIAVKEQENTIPLLYRLEFSLFDTQKLVLANDLEDEMAQHFVMRLFDFLEIEY